MGLQVEPKKEKTRVISGTKWARGQGITTRTRRTASHRYTGHRASANAGRFAVAAAGGEAFREADASAVCRWSGPRKQNHPPLPSPQCDEQLSSPLRKQQRRSERGGRWRGACGGTVGASRAWRRCFCQFVASCICTAFVRLDSLTHCTCYMQTACCYFFRVTGGIIPNLNYW